jgi:hypothetical protein
MFIHRAQRTWPIVQEHFNVVGEQVERKLMATGKLPSATTPANHANNAEDSAAATAAAANKRSPFKKPGNSYQQHQQPTVTWRAEVGPLDSKTVEQAFRQMGLNPPSKGQQQAARSRDQPRPMPTPFGNPNRYYRNTYGRTGPRQDPSRRASNYNQPRRRGQANYSTTYHEPPEFYEDDAQDAAAYAAEPDETEEEDFANYAETVDHADDAAGEDHYETTA